MERQKNQGITLIALVITIIVLLILAGVSLSLVAGENGILKRATTAVDKNNQAQINEEVELAMADLKTAYYEDFYDKGTTTDSWSEYAQAKLQTGVDTNNGKLKLSGTQVTYTDSKGKVSTGTFDTETGKVVITDVNVVPKKTIQFTIVMAEGGFGEGQSFSFEAYENETWAEWYQRVEGTDIVKDIETASNETFSHLLGYKTGEYNIHTGTAGGGVTVWLKLEDTFCRSDDKIIALKQYKLYGLGV